MSRLYIYLHIHTHCIYDAYVCVCVHIYEGWVTWVIWRFTKNLCLRRGAQWVGMLSWWSWQSPVVCSCSLLNHPNSLRERMFKLNAKFDENSLLYSVILNAMATQYTCLLNRVHCPHWLLQWGHHCSHMQIPVHSTWLPSYINVIQTVLVILTVAELFPDTLRISNHHVEHFQYLMGFFVNYTSIKLKKKLLLLSTKSSLPQER